MVLPVKFHLVNFIVKHLLQVTSSKWPGCFQMLVFFVRHNNYTLPTSSTGSTLTLRLCEIPDGWSRFSSARAGYALTNALKQKNKFSLDFYEWISMAWALIHYSESSKIKLISPFVNSFFVSRQGLLKKSWFVVWWFTSGFVESKIVISFLLSESLTCNWFSYQV